MNSINEVVVFTDGGSRGNPGKAAYGFVIKKGDVLLHQQGEYIGITTNNVAEYTAIVKALSWIEENTKKIGEFSGVHVFMDSLLACQQLKNVFRIKQPHLLKLFQQVKQKEQAIAKEILYTHIPREKNKAADAMVNRALDSLI